MYLLDARFLSEKITSSAQFSFSSLKLHYKETAMTTYQNMWANDYLHRHVQIQFDHEGSQLLLSLTLMTLICLNIR